MDATSFELHLSLPADARLAGMMRDLAAHAARYAGGRDRAADEFGSAVEALIARFVASGAAATPISVVLRRARGPLEVSVTDQTRTQSLSFAL